MPSSAVIDVDALVAPIDGDDPSGVSVPFSLRETLDLARKEVNPDDYDPQDPTRPTEPKYADWAGIVERTSEALVETSKDLLLLARLIEGLVKLHGFAGLRDGLRLGRMLIEDAWERLRPPVEEPDDLEARAAPFNWLDDPERGARFPITIRSVMILPSPSGTLSWTSWYLMQQGRGDVKVEDFDRAVAASSREHCQTVVDDLLESQTELERLQTAMAERMESVAPGLSTLRRAIQECLLLAKQILEKKGPAPQAAEAVDGDNVSAGEGMGDGGGDGSYVGRTARSRAQIYQRLAEAAEMLRQIEPHSPVPYLIRRAVDLGDLPFPELMRQLISDAAALSEMYRKLGIPETEE
jgi:type VI secretion system protein ImpA